MAAKKPSRTEQILRLAQASPGIKKADAADILGMSPASLGTYITKLRKAGLLKKTRGTLELEPGVDVEAAIASGAGASSSPSSSPKAKPAAKSKSSRNVLTFEVSDEERQMLVSLVQEGARRAESYRQEGLLTNLVLVGCADGSTVIRGLFGGGALVCNMLGFPDRDILEDPGMQQYLAERVRTLGEGQGEVAVFYDLTDLQDPDQALVTGWVGGKRVVCAVAGLDGALSGPESKDRWEDLDDEQAARLYNRHFENYRQAVSESEDGQPGGTAMRQLNPDPEAAGQALAAVMGDPERAPSINFTIQTEEESMADPAISDAVRLSAEAEIEKMNEVATELSALGKLPGKASQLPADIAQAFSELDLWSQLLVLSQVNPGMKASKAAKFTGASKDQVIEQLSELQGSGMLEAGTDTLRFAMDSQESGTPDSSSRAAAGSAQPSGGIEAVIARAIYQVEKERRNSTLVNFVEIAKADGDIIRAGMGGGQIMLPMSGMLGDQMAEMIASLAGGQGRQAVFVSMMDLASDGVDRVVMAAWDGSTLAGAWTALVTDGPLDQLDNWMSIDAEALLQIGMQSHAANQAAGEEEDEGSLTISAPMSAPDSGMSEQEKQAELERRVQMHKDMTVLACAIAEENRQGGIRDNTILVGLQDGSVMRGDSDNFMAIMCGALGDETGAIISKMGEDQGIMAVFLNMADLPANPDGTYMALMSMWAGSNLVGGMSAIAGNQSLEYGEGAWMEILPEKFMEMVGSAAQRTAQDFSEGSS